MAGWIAIAAAAIAVLAIAIALVLHVRLRRVRAAQLTLLGERRRRPRRLRRLAAGAGRRAASRRSTRSRRRSARLDRRVDATVSRLAVVRYDAYENTGGHQSASVALLDASRSGVVLSAIQGRDYARIYVKELEGGRAAVALSPEEQEAVERAMKSQQ